MFESPKRHHFSLKKLGTLQIPNAFARTPGKQGEASGKSPRRNLPASNRLGEVLRVTRDVTQNMENEMEDARQSPHLIIKEAGA